LIAGPGATDESKERLQQLSIAQEDRDKK